MRKAVIILGILLTAGIGATWTLVRPHPDWRGRAQMVLSSESTNILETGDQFALLSLDPEPVVRQNESDPPPEGAFHFYKILGQTEIRDAQERADLLEALYQGIAGAEEGVHAACFNPRHGIRATLHGETVDLVICYECLSMQVYDTNERNVLTSGSPARTFNAALIRAGVPLPKN